MNTHYPAAQCILDHVMKGTNLIVAVMDDKGIIKQANRRAEQFAGSSLAGKPFDTLVIDFKKSFSLDDALRADKEQYLLHIVNKEGLPNTYYFTFQRTSDGIVAIGQQDPDEIDHMRRNLLDMNNELNDLTRRLQKKNARLEELAFQKNQFFGMASHDLRHPLGTITMFSRFLLEEAADRLDTEHREFLGHILESGELMQQILDDFMDVAAMEAGRLELNLRRVEMTGWLKRVVQYNAVVAAQKNIHIVFQPICSSFAMTLDASKMEQVMNNLISNAVKFSEAGKKILVQMDKDETGVCIRVEDQGPGIAEQDLQKIFLPFHRGLFSQKEGGKSSGLGLAIVKKIVEAHGGHARAENIRSSGACFTICLPHHPADLLARDHEAKEESSD